jgi:hypothetical protein
VLSIVAGHDPHDPGSADVSARDYAAGIDAPIAGIVIGAPWRWLEEEAPCTPETRDWFNDPRATLHLDRPADPRPTTGPRPPRALAYPVDTFASV